MRNYGHHEGERALTGQRTPAQPLGPQGISGLGAEGDFWDGFWSSPEMYRGADPPAPRWRMWALGLTAVGVAGFFAWKKYGDKALAFGASLSASGTRETKAPSGSGTKAPSGYQPAPRPASRGYGSWGNP